MIFILSFPADLMLENLAALSCRSMRLRRIWRTSSRTSGSSFREKDSSGSRKELGSAVSMLVVWKPAVTWREHSGGHRSRRKDRKRRTFKTSVKNVHRLYYTLHLYLHFIIYTKVLLYLLYLWNMRNTIYLVLFSCLFGSFTVCLSLFFFVI